MSSFAPNTLPIIDVAPLLDSGHQDTDHELRASTSAALHDACVQYGFFYLNISAYVDPSEPEQLTELARSFFSLPQEEKDKLALNNEDNARGLIYFKLYPTPCSDPLSGYARLKENVTNGKADNHEGLDFYKPVENPDKSKPLWGENQWPSNPDFKDKYQQWVEKMKVLGLIVMQA
jgi:isopenicillin N synthase-like dioxygenase